jgi:hypothetical protein
VVDRHPQLKAEEYRDTAAKLRQKAEGMTSRDAWLTIIELAERFEQLAERAGAASPSSDATRPVHTENA